MLSVIRASHEELLGSWALATADLIKVCRSKDLQVYSAMANAFDRMADSNARSNPQDPFVIFPVVDALLAISSRAHSFLADIPITELEFQRRW